MGKENSLRQRMQMPGQKGSQGQDHAGRAFNFNIMSWNASSEASVRAAHSSLIISFHSLCLGEEGGGGRLGRQSAQA